MQTVHLEIVFSGMNDAFAGFIFLVFTKFKLNCDQECTV
jgi:hypothetical protein